MGKKYTFFDLISRTNAEAGKMVQPLINSNPITRGINNFTNEFADAIAFDKLRFEGGFDPLPVAQPVKPVTSTAPPTQIQPDQSWQPLSQEELAWASGRGNGPVSVQTQPNQPYKLVQQPAARQPSFYEILGSMMQIAPNVANMAQRFLPSARRNNTQTQPAQPVQPQPDQARMAEAENQRRMIEMMGLLGEQGLKGGKLTKAPDMMGTLNARAEKEQAERARLLANYKNRQAQI